ncbi:MAG: phosphosulfolactate synthase, partial [Mycobacteriaceae bacterium]
MHTALTLPERSRKPRSTGLTMVIDGGLPIRLFRDVIA